MGILKSIMLTLSMLVMHVTLQWYVLLFILIMGFYSIYSNKRIKRAGLKKEFVIQFDIVGKLKL